MVGQVAGDGRGEQLARGGHCLTVRRRCGRPQRVVRLRGQDGLRRGADRLESRAPRSARRTYPSIAGRWPGVPVRPAALGRLGCAPPRSPGPRRRGGCGRHGPARPRSSGPCARALAACGDGLAAEIASLVAPQLAPSTWAGPVLGSGRSARDRALSSTQSGWPRVGDRDPGPAGPGRAVGRCGASGGWAVGRPGRRPCSWPPWPAGWPGRSTGLDALARVVGVVADGFARTEVAVRAPVRAAAAGACRAPTWPASPICSVGWTPRGVGGPARRRRPSWPQLVVDRLPTPSGSVADAARRLLRPCRRAGHRWSCSQAREPAARPADRRPAPAGPAASGAGLRAGLGAGRGPVRGDPRPGQRRVGAAARRGCSEPSGSRAGGRRAPPALVRRAAHRQRGAGPPGRHAAWSGRTSCWPSTRAATAGSRRSSATWRRARHLAVYVPGTGTSLDRYAGNAERASAFAAAEPDLAVVLWQDADFPDQPLDHLVPPIALWDRPVQRRRSTSCGRTCWPRRTAMPLTAPVPPARAATSTGCGWPCPVRPPT